MNGSLQIFLILILYFLQSETLKHGSSRKCLAISEKKDRLLMESCQPKEPRQRWKFSTYNPSNASSPWEQIKNLRKFAKNARIPEQKQKKEEIVKEIFDLRHVPFYQYHSYLN